MTALTPWEKTVALALPGLAAIIASFQLEPPSNAIVSLGGFAYFHLMLGIAAYSRNTTEGILISMVSLASIALLALGNFAWDSQAAMGIGAALLAIPFIFHFKALKEAPIKENT